MPDLLLVDGGLLQVQAAVQIRQELGIDLTIGGLVKDDRHSTRGLLLEDGTEVPLDRKEPLFFLLTKMQDEVHRFAISYHRSRRTKAMTRSVLDEVPGIGPARKQELQKRFKSMKRMKAASLEELEEVLPRDVARRLMEKFAGMAEGETGGSGNQPADAAAVDATGDMEAELAALADELALLDARDIPSDASNGDGKAGTDEPEASQPVPAADAGRKNPADAGMVE